MPSIPPAQTAAKILTEAGIAPAHAEAIVRAIISLREAGELADGSKHASLLRWVDKIAKEVGVPRD